MARRLVLEISNVEARALLLAVSDSRIAVEQSLTIPLADEQDSTGKKTAEQRIVDALARAELTRLETIVVVGRADIELRLLTVPPAPETELPNLVRFQATQELPNLDENTLLDYLPLDETPGEPRRVLAAVLKPGIKQRLDKICLDAKLTLSQIVLRSAASASFLLGERPELKNGCCLMVEMLGRRVELAAVNRCRVVFLRHMLLSTDPTETAEAAESLLAEIRRTRVVVTSQENGEAVRPIVVIGDKQSSRELIERLAGGLDVPVVLVDPLPTSVVVDSRVDMSRGDRQHATALLAAARDEAIGNRPAFDFLNPRRAPKPPSRRGWYVAAAAVAAVLLLGFLVYQRIQTANLYAEVEQLRDKAKKNKPLVEQAEKIIAASSQVADWQAGEVMWLDELRWLSQQYPGAQDARITKLTLLGNERTREMVFSGLARDAAVKAKINETLRDANHTPRPSSSDDEGNGQYRIKFGSSIRLTPKP